MEIYVIQPGDTLTAIAAGFGVSLERLLEINGLPNPDRLVVGQAILIPEPPQQFLVYTIMPGDTLWAIARRFGVSVGLIARVNQIENPSLIFPFQTLIIPQEVPGAIRPDVETLAYVFSDIGGLERALSVAGPCLTYTALFQLRVSRSGRLVIPANAQAVVDLSRQYGIVPLAVVTNWEGELFQPDLAHDIMANDEIRERTIASVREALAQYGFAGVNIDFENMYPEDRPLFNRFIRELRDALKPAGYLVTIAVAPKASDRPNEPWVGIFDYATLGQLVDIMYIMTYEWGWIGGPPMAIAPINQVRRVLSYATSLVPPEKLIQGIPLYGYNWPLPDTPESLATTVSLTGVYDLAFNAGASISYDDTSQSPWFRYTDPRGGLHEVWFEDPRSLRVKYELAQEFGLRGVGFWTSVNPNYAFRQIWSLLCDTFSVVKREA